MMVCEKCGYSADAPIAQSWLFLVERDPASLNTGPLNKGVARWKYGKERDAWQWEFRAVRLLQKIPIAKAKRRVTLTRFYDGRQQERDPDNLAGGMKVVVDSLVREGLLQNDDRATAEIHYQQERRSPRGLGVLIEEFANAG